MVHRHRSCREGFRSGRRRARFAAAHTRPSCCSNRPEDRAADPNPGRLRWVGREPTRPGPRRATRRARLRFRHPGRRARSVDRDHRGSGRRTSALPADSIACHRNRGVGGRRSCCAGVGFGHAASELAGLSGTVAANSVYRVRDTRRHRSEAVGAHNHRGGARGVDCTWMCAAARVLVDRQGTRPNSRRGRSLPCSCRRASSAAYCVSAGNESRGQKLLAAHSVRLPGVAVALERP